MTRFDYPPCDPPPGPVALAEHEDPAITARMQALFAADQADRQSMPIDWERVSREDAERRHEVMRSLAAGQIGAPESLFHAAFIFQHGNSPEHYELAHQLAAHAVERGYERARWICAAALDRALMSRGQPQKYGTQYVSRNGGPLELYEYDPCTTDEERQRNGVPPLREILRGPGRIAGDGSQE